MHNLNANFEYSSELQNKLPLTDSMNEVLSIQSLHLSDENRHADFE